MGICTKDHADIESILESIQPYQGGEARHICAGCAYEQGVADAQSGKPADPQKAFKRIPDSQAKPQRHKNAYEAYRAGYRSIA